MNRTEQTLYFSQFNSCRITNWGKMRNFEHRCNNENLTEGEGTWETQAST